jgi:hypothetical protein
VQPASADEKGSWSPNGWNKVIYDAAGKRVLFYDRWLDKKHGGYTIYANCLFAFDPATQKLSTAKIDNWTKEEVSGGCRTIPLPENTKEPSPAPRHPCHYFELAPELKSLFMTLGTNQTVMDGDKLVGSDGLENTWRLDMEKNLWSKVPSTLTPRNFPPDGGMAWCPDTKTIVLAKASEIWILDVATGQWRKSKAHTPPAGMGQSVFYDPPRKRVLIMGGPITDVSVKPVENRKETAGYQLSAFDPRTETITKLADSPTIQFEGHLAYHPKLDVFLMANVAATDTKPGGTFFYDPKKDTWQQIKTTNPIPVPRDRPDSWYGWVRMCYCADYDCFIGLSADRDPKTGEGEFYALKYVPQK